MVLQRAQPIAVGMADERHRIGRIAEVGHRGRRRGDVVEPVGPHHDDARSVGHAAFVAVAVTVVPDPADQGSVGAVVWQDIAGRSWHWTSPFLT